MSSIESVMTAVKLLLKAGLRIEKKLDEVLKLNLKMVQKQEQSPIPPVLQKMSSPTPSQCPLCQTMAVYRIIDLPAQEGALPDRIISRFCGCEPTSIQP